MHARPQPLGWWPNGLPIYAKENISEMGKQAGRRILNALRLGGDPDELI